MSVPRRDRFPLPGLAGLCAALLPPEQGGPDPVELAGRVERFVANMPAAPRHALRGGVAALQGASVATTGRQLGRLDPDRRARVLERVAAGRADAVDALKAAILLVHGAHAFGPDMLARSNQDDPARPDAALDVTPSRHWPGYSRAGAVVIGSGAGGAMAARTLARAGIDVVVLEEGRRFSVEEFRSRAPIDRFADLYRDAGTTIALGSPPVVMPIGRGVGGTTLVNSGTCYRTPARVQKAWRDGAGLALAGPERFEDYLDEVEATLQVAPVPDGVMGRNGQLMLAGAAALGWRAGPLRRNAPGCGGCCQCAIGCPRNAKFGVHLNALPQACEAGARVVSEARVSRLLVEGGRAVGVRARRPGGSTFDIRASIVVVAAGTTETPPLLRRSGLGRHPQLGRNLTVHPSVGVAGRFDEPVVAWRGVLQSAGVEEFHESHGLLIEATSTPPGMGSMILPGYGRRLLEEIEAADHLVSLGAMAADKPSGAVHGRRQPILRYQIDRTAEARLLRGIAVMAEVLFAAGATEVLTGVPRAPVVRTMSELDDALAATRARRLHVAAFHPSGTARAGADEQAYPVDEEGRLRGVAGVWVADASILPSSPEVNPQISIMALALAVADQVVARAG